MDEKQTRAFWNRKNLMVGDYNGLARVYLSNVFGSDFLQPLEVGNKHFVIEIGNSSALEFLDSLFDPDS